MQLISNITNISAPRFSRFTANGVNIYLSRSKYYYVNEEKEKTWSDIMDTAATHMFLFEIYRGFGITLSQLFREPATINYPFEKGPLSPRFRGEHALRRYILCNIIFIHFLIYIIFYIIQFLYNILCTYLIYMVLYIFIQNKAPNSCTL